MPVFLSYITYRNIVSVVILAITSYSLNNALNWSLKGLIECSFLKLEKKPKNQSVVLREHCFLIDSIHFPIIFFYKPQLLVKSMMISTEKQTSTIYMAMKGSWCKMLIYGMLILRPRITYLVNTKFWIGSQKQRFNMIHCIMNTNLFN